MQKFLPSSKTTLVVSTSLLLSIIGTDESYPDLNEELLNKLNRILNVCIRYNFGFRKYDDMSQFCSKLNWLSIRLRRNAHMLYLLYGILFDPLYNISGNVPLR